MALNNVLKERLRSEKAESLIMTAQEAALFIEDGMTLGVSGFTPVDDPKLIPKAISERAKAGTTLRLDIYSGGALGPIDNEMVLSGVTRRRIPFVHSDVGREGINKGAVLYNDMHLSKTTEYIDYHFLNRIDFAIVEVLAITEDGDLVPSVGVGNLHSIIRNSDKVLVEVAMNKPILMEGMHDIYMIENPPLRREIPVYSSGDRIGDTVIKCGWEKIKGIVLSYEEDRPHVMSPIDENSKKIAENVVKFLEDEIEAGRLPEKLPPFQSGLGNVANALLKSLSNSKLEGLTAYTEVIQDGMIELIEKGKLDYASATCMTLSKECYKKVFENIEFFRKKIVLRGIDVSNNPEVIRRLGVIAINTALEVDIYGNVNSTHVMGKKMMNGIGGSSDFAKNARLSIFTTPSIAKNGDISSIVPMCSHIDHTEHDVMVIITEQGIADLRGLSPKERAMKIIENCVNPIYKEALMSYFFRACSYSMCQTPHILEEALSWHIKYEKEGTMR